jgi:peptidoglycan hydrolase CwlO-like protein
MFKKYRVITNLQNEVREAREKALNATNELNSYIDDINAIENIVLDEWKAYSIGDKFYHGDDMFDNTGNLIEVNMEPNREYLLKEGVSGIFDNLREQARRYRKLSEDIEKKDKRYNYMKEEVKRMDKEIEELLEYKGKYYSLLRNLK